MKNFYVFLFSMVLASSVFAQFEIECGSFKKGPRVHLIIEKDGTSTPTPDEWVLYDKGEEVDNEKAQLNRTSTKIGISFESTDATEWKEYEFSLPAGGNAQVHVFKATRPDKKKMIYSASCP